MDTPPDTEVDRPDDAKLHETARRLPEGRREAILNRVDTLEGRPVTALMALL